MSTYRKHLPQLDGGLFLTDGGIETDLIFNDGMELPYFAAFDLLKSEKGAAVLRAYYVRYATIAKANGVGFILESPTWRASADWGQKLGYSQAAPGVKISSRNFGRDRRYPITNKFREEIAGAPPAAHRDRKGS